MLTASSRNVYTPDQYAGWLLVWPSSERFGVLAMTSAYHICDCPLTVWRFRAHAVSSFVTVPDVVEDEEEDVDELSSELEESCTEDAETPN